MTDSWNLNLSWRDWVYTAAFGLVPATPVWLLVWFLSGGGQ